MHPHCSMRLEPSDVSVVDLRHCHQWSRGSLGLSFVLCPLTQYSSGLCFDPASYVPLIYLLCHAPLPPRGMFSHIPLTLRSTSHVFFVPRSLMCPITLPSSSHVNVPQHYVLSFHALHRVFSTFSPTTKLRRRRQP